ncbi:MAG TPA: hypothetical protein VGQ56_19220, partial [Gemmatimonadaceae bacterium]|nr:hypothetical protein [Gemmatimonadaceae bacterium]
AFIGAAALSGTDANIDRSTAAVSHLAPRSLSRNVFANSSMMAVDFNLQPGADPVAAAQTMADAGITFARIGTYWYADQPTEGSAVNTAGLDAQVPALLNVGITPYITIQGTPSWASGSSDGNAAPTAAHMAEYHPRCQDSCRTTAVG